MDALSEKRPRRFHYLQVLVLWCACGSLPPAHKTLPVYYDETSYAQFGDALDSARSLWNRRLGCVALPKAESPDKAAILIAPYDGDDCDAVLPPFMAFTCFRQPMEIRTKNLATSTEAFLITLHELGHALGLPDTHVDYGVMRWQYRHPKRSDPPFIFLIDDATAARVREEYCQ